MMNAVQYDRIDDQGLHITVGGKAQVLEVDNVVICAGQRSNNAMDATLKAKGIAVHLIGGAFLATELDAKRAIDQGSRLAAGL